VLGGRGYEVPFWQQVAWHCGIALTAIGLLSPIDGLGEELLIAHMGQHLLIEIAEPGNRSDRRLAVFGGGFDQARQLLRRDQAAI
jgi:cytochrome c oxidase assembly factor CtaG